MPEGRRAASASEFLWRALDNALVSCPTTNNGLSGLGFLWRLVQDSGVRGVVDTVNQLS